MRSLCAGSRMPSPSAGDGMCGWTPEGIQDGEVFPEAIKRAIEQSDTFLFVITPNAVNSAYCENEVEYARQMQKRILPVLREPVPDAELPGRDPGSQLDPVHRGRGFRAGDGAAGHRAGHRSGGHQGSYPLAGEGARVGLGASRQQLPATRVGAQGGRGMARGHARATPTRPPRRCSASTCWPVARPPRGASAR